MIGPKPKALPSNLHVAIGGYNVFVELQPSLQEGCTALHSSYNDQLSEALDLILNRWQQLPAYFAALELIRQLDPKGGWE